MKLPSLDLHGVKHADAKRILIQFIEDHWDHPDHLDIITGHSNNMKAIVFEVAGEYNLKVEFSIYNTALLKLIFS